MERVSYLHSTDDGPKSPKPVCYLIKELNPKWFMCQLRFQTIFSPFFRAGELNPFITGYEPRMQFAISLTAEQISQSASFQVQLAQNEEWVQWPQIEIQPTTGALVE